MKPLTILAFSAGALLGFTILNHARKVHNRVTEVECCREAAIERIVDGLLDDEVSSEELLAIIDFETNFLQVVYYSM